jgi:predicted Rossmann fold flavoprotein
VSVAPGFRVELEREGQRVTVQARNVVVASGGLSIPKMGATGLAYDIARQFGHRIVDARPGLVPLTFPEGRFADLAGVALPARVSTGKTGFDEALLFTHRGLSGPAVLQASSYWHEGSEIAVNLLPGQDAAAWLLAEKRASARKQLATVLAQRLPARLADRLAAELPPETSRGPMADRSDAVLCDLAGRLTDWRLKPAGTEGWRTAEVTLGGVDTRGLDSRTMMSAHQAGLYFIGECVDVTGWLGGYNFQWAWASAVAAAEGIAARG